MSEGSIGPDDVLVAVVGVTGSGKSQLIQTITQDDSIVIGHNLKSETNAVAQYDFSAKGVNFKLIDTPGFDDTDLDDEDVFRMISKWLEGSYRKGQQLTGIIYLNRIIDTRQKGSAIRNLRMFKKLCGKNNFKNIILGITFWDKEPDLHVAEAREKELRKTPEFWGDMIAQGSRVERIPNEREACINLLLSLAPNEKVTLCIQSELVDQGLSLEETAAATEIQNYEELKAIRDQEARSLQAQKKAHESAIRKKDRHLQSLMMRARIDFEAQQLADQQAERALEEEKLAILQKQEESRRQKRVQEQKQRQLESAKLKEQQRELQISITTRQNRDRHQRRVQREHRRSLAHIASIKSQADLIKTSMGYRRVQQTVQANPHFSEGAFCDVCLRHVTIDTRFWSCAGCTEKFDFIMCNICKQTKQYICWCDPIDYPNSAHNLRPATFGPAAWPCPRAVRGAYDLHCDSCSKPPGSIYLHCCICCNDNFDLCVECWGRGAHCQNPTSHFLIPFGWVPPGERPP
ncbi:hypothetical protein BT63DRAFT_461594 [Microthyrium microscopicum]|uniref:G domain-containing protein n=1 Tax=Microthyrium microscopicum TaxID=703497 RepID=A0A6A6TTR3_9PEZI|nr:hypothetical protein BT63DRAFT_461594 [Microthyrium microscopicum]